ncbi:hypothetical protein ACV229_07120 [Burkholderia sp. MR1-5-21]
MTDITFHHAPDCRTARHARATFRDSDIEANAVRDPDMPQDDAEDKHA